MPGRDIFLSGFSAGGVEARLVGALPHDLPASLFAAHQYPADGVSVLPSILQRSGALEEKAELSRRMAERIPKRGLERMTLRYRDSVEDAERGSDAIRQLLLDGSASPPVPLGAGIPEKARSDLAGAESA